MLGIKTLLMVRVGCLLISFSAVGQSEKFTIPAKLPQTVNTNLEETLPLLSPGGDTLYFTRFNLHVKNAKPVKGHDIWYAVKRNNTWSEVKNDLLNLVEFNSVVGISADGQTLFLLKYEGKAYSSTAGIAYSEKIDGKWQMPQPWAGQEIFTANSFFGFSLNQEENVLIISMKGINTLGKEDLYVSFKNNDETWSVPRHMGPVINTRGFEISPFLCSDNKTLYFASNGHGGFGDADIFVTHRLDDQWNNWSEPMNLGKPINSAGFDGYFTRNNDQDIFFVSNRGTSFTDIYHTSIADEKDENSEQPILAVSELDGNLDDGDGNKGNSELNGNSRRQDVNVNQVGNGEEGRKGIDTQQGKINGTQGNNKNSKHTENGEDHSFGGKASSGLRGDSDHNETMDEHGKNKRPEDEFISPDDITANMVTGAVIYFGLDVSTLTPIAQDDLLKVVETLKEQKNYKVALIGYTDQSGGERYNMKLSKKRAKAARDFLIAKGLDKSMVTDEGKGIYRVLSSDSGEETRKWQRRVDIKYEILNEN